MEQFFVDQLAALLHTDVAAVEIYSLSLKPAGGLNLQPDTLLMEVLLSRVDLSYDDIVTMLLGAAFQTRLGAFKIERVKSQQIDSGSGRGKWIDIRASRS